jgi:small subunit ribosomal protein S1
MPIPDAPDTNPTPESTESFSDLLQQFEKTHHKSEPGQQIEGTVVSITVDSVLLDIGFKSEGILPLSIFENAKTPPKPGDKFLVSVKGRNPEGYYELSRTRIAQPTDWPALERAFAEKTTIMGTVTGAVKGGLTVDVGVRAFLPASRTGTRDAAEMEKLVGQEIRCRITKLDAADEDCVVDRRIVLEEEERLNKDRRFSEVQEGDTVRGTIRSLTDYGAFVDLGGVDALLHVSDISWSRIAKPSDALTVGQDVEAKVLKMSNEGGKRRISVGLKQLLPHPWDALAGKFSPGDRAHGTVTRVADFGAFVELEPGVEGLIHVSEMSWTKKIRAASDVLKPGDTVEAVILSINPAERRMSLGLKQALGNPWADFAQKLPVGSVVEGPVMSLTKFGAFIQISEGIEGMVHISEISAEKRLNHPQDMLRVGQTVQAEVLTVDTDKRQVRLSMKQLVPTGLDEYLAEHKVGDIVSGRLIETTGNQARVELGEGIVATCQLPDEAKKEDGVKKPNQSVKQDSATKDSAPPKADLSSLSSMLQARWKGASKEAAQPEPIRQGQIRNFRITTLDAPTKKIAVEFS